MIQEIPGDTRNRSMRLLARVEEKYGRTSGEFREALKFFKAGYDAALDDFLEATTLGQENINWYNDAPTLQAVRRKFGLRRSKR